MKKGLVIFYFLLTNICFGQLYHAGTGEVVQPRPHWEVALGWSASSGEISLKNGSTSSNGQHGLMGRVMYIPVQSLSLGVEGIVFSDQKISPLVDKYSAQRFGILASYNLTPDTNPHVYTLVG